MNRTRTVGLAKERAAQDIHRVVLSVLLGVAASGCYVEPEHPRHHEVRIETRREGPRREHHHGDDDDHHHEHHD